MKVGILGFAHGHVFQYIQQWQSHPELDIQVVRGWDHDEKRKSDACKKYGLEEGECPYCIVNDPEIEAVVIAAETSKHAELVEIAAEAGKAIIVQKPLCITMDEANRIVKAVNDHKVPFTMAWQMRVDPQNQKMKEIMQSGILGKIFHFERWHHLGFLKNEASQTIWHVIPSLNRDIWADDSAHPIDLMHWLFGMPESVSAELGTFFSKKVPNDNGVAIFRYPGGPLVEICCSFVAGGAEKTTEILGDKGVLVQSYGDAVSCSMPRDEKAVGIRYYLEAEKQWHEVDIPSPHAQSERLGALAKPLAEFLHGKREAIATAEDARDSLRLVLATYVANEEGRRVSPFDPAVDKIPYPQD